MSNAQTHTEEILALTADIADDLKVIEQLAADLNDCAECDDPLCVDDLNKLVTFCDSIRTLAVNIIKQADILRP